MPLVTSDLVSGVAILIKDSFPYTGSFSYCPTSNIGPLVTSILSTSFELSALAELSEAMEDETDDWSFTSSAALSGLSCQC